MGYRSDVAICCRAKVYNNFRDHLEEIIKEKCYDVRFGQNAHILAKNVKEFLDCAQFRAPRVERRFYPDKFKNESYIVIYWKQVKWYYEDFPEVQVIHDYFKNVVDEDLDYGIIGEDYDDVKFEAYNLGLIWINRFFDGF